MRSHRPSIARLARTLPNDPTSELVPGGVLALSASGFELASVRFSLGVRIEEIKSSREALVTIFEHSSEKSLVAAIPMLNQIWQIVDGVRQRRHFCSASGCQPIPFARISK